MFVLILDASSDYYQSHESGINNPTEAQIRSTIEAIAQGKQDLAILRGDDELTYIQTAEGGRGKLLLEYQDGSPDAHYGVRAPLPTPEQVINAFIAFLHGDSTWRSQFIWEKMEF